MSERRVLEQQSLGALFEKLRAAGQRILAPVDVGPVSNRVGPVFNRSAKTSVPPQAIRDELETGPAATTRNRLKTGPTATAFAEITGPDEMLTGYIQTTLSPKSAVFPSYEPLIRYRFVDKDVQVDDDLSPPPPTVLFGVRPCDAAALGALRAVFTWGTPDRPFESKHDRLTVIGVSCTEADEYCFCTSVGRGPGDPTGSDLLLTPTDGAAYIVDIVTEKGAAVVALAPQLFSPLRAEHKPAALASVPPRFELKRLAERLPALFNRAEVWTEQSLPCLGCGTCAFVCPSCACFDIQDEADRRGGVRLRCWDSCGFAQFTLHTSGHNPRTKQSERWRQRVMHKFAYMPERLGMLGCVGCGRCARACPADMNLAEHLTALAETSA